MIRKTAKYYREALKNNPSEELLKEIVIKYGEEREIFILRMLSSTGITASKDFVLPRAIDYVSVSTGREIPRTAMSMCSCLMSEEDGEATAKMTTHIDEMSDEDFLKELEPQFNGYDFVSERDYDTIANEEADV